MLTSHTLLIGPASLIRQTTCKLMSIGLLLKTSGSDWPQIRHIALQLGQAIQHLHEHGKIIKNYVKAACRNPSICAIFVYVILMHRKRQ
jgi:hypothetical protein